MIARGSRLRQVGWAAALSICLALFVALTFRVNAVKSEVQLAERQIIALERQKLLLETEFQTRASQRQLSNWNAVEFGYVAPRADQYLEHERNLASLGEARGPGAPAPIRVARADTGEAKRDFPQMVSPLTGERIERRPEPAPDTSEMFAESFAELLPDPAGLQGRVAE